MASPKLVFSPPPTTSLFNYRLYFPPSHQPGTVPRLFRDALIVREKVFIEEKQAVPRHHGLDRDDARAYNWILYSEESQQPIGTIRLIPPLHHPHPEPGSSFDAPSEDIPAPLPEDLFSAPLPEGGKDKKTTFHDGEEVYVKLGRLAVVKEERGKRYADLLIEGALKWAKENPRLLGFEGGEWKGLVCCHAQEGAVGVWERNGFVVDEGMGTWFEVGIKHFGMFRRVEGLTGK